MEVVQSIPPDEFFAAHKDHTLKTQGMGCFVLELPSGEQSEQTLCAVLCCDCRAITITDSIVHSP